MVVCFTLRVSIFFTNTPSTVLMLQSMVMHKTLFPVLVGHMSRVWDHVHLTPGKIPPNFDPSDLYVAQRYQK